MALITVSGTQNVGKSTYIRDFLDHWPMFKTPEKTYRELAKERGAKLNKEADQESQKIIRDSLIEQIDSYSRKKNVIFDRCPLDNLVYTLWLYEHDKGDIDADFVAESIKKTRLAIQRIDLMILIPSVDKIKLVADGVRDIDKQYREEINNIFVDLKEKRENGDDIFFVAEDCAPIIDISGTREDRIEQTKLYLKDNGEFYGEEDSCLFDGNGELINKDDFNPIEDRGESDLLRKKLGIKNNFDPNSIIGDISGFEHIKKNIGL